MHEQDSDWYGHRIQAEDDAQELEIYISDKINERYYGDLQGMNKDWAIQRYGAEQVHLWRRSYDIPPPNGESLKMTAARTLPYYRERIVPYLQRGDSVLVSAHGHYGAERLGCAVIPVSGGMTERQVQLIHDLKPEIVMVTPSYMLAILDEFRKEGVDPRDCSLKVGLFGAEPWTNAMRAEIEQSFDMHAVDIYGLSEVIGPGVACECVETKDGPHIWEDHFYPEVIDSETGAVLPDGAMGEIVFTSLTKEAMPIVRYRTRDLTRLLPGTARTMRRMEKIAGRSDDKISLRGVNVFPSQIEEQILKMRRAVAALPDRTFPARAHGRDDRRRRGAPARRGRGRARGAGARARPSRQVGGRRHGRGPRRRSRHGRAFAGQGQTGRRPQGEGVNGKRLVVRILRLGARLGR